MKKLVANGCRYFFTLTLFHFLTFYARVAQWIERFPPEEEVAGSTPAVSIQIKKKGIRTTRMPFLIQDQSTALRSDLHHRVTD